MLIKFRHLVLPIVFLVGCREAEPTWKQHAFPNEEQNRTTSEAKLPAELWDKINRLASGPGVAAPAVDHGTGGGGEHGGGGHEEAKAADHGGGEHGGGGGHGAADNDGANPSPASIPSAFAPITVYFIEKNHGILNKGNTKVVFPAGGGELDLSSIVQNKNGSFYVVIEFLPEIDKSIEKKVYFLSRGLERTLDGEKYGAGCQSYFDVSTAFKNMVAKDGFLVNTTAGRHVSALAGIYFFAAFVEGKLQLASLTIKDSTRRELQCGK
jgi:hypothetical protein